MSSINLRPRRSSARASRRLGIAARKHTVALALGLSVLSAMPGCFSMRSAANTRAAPAVAAPAAAWPVRDAAAAERLRAQTPSTISWYEWEDGKRPPGMNDRDSAQLQRVEAEVSDSRCLSGGLLRIYREPEEESDVRDLMGHKFAAMLGDFEPNGSYVSSYILESDRFKDWLDSERELRSTMKPLTGTAPEGLRRSMLSAELALDGGVRFQLPPAGAAGQRGLILHFSALITNEYEKRFLDRLRERGWAVIDFDTWSGLQSPRDPAALARLPALEKRRKELEAERWAMTSRKAPQSEFTASLEETYAVVREMQAIRRGWFTCCSAADAEATGRDIAATVDDALAENAYAAEAVLDYVQQARPDIPTSPVIVVGFSAGAIAAPAVAARLGERVSALVLVGGGADILAMSRTTNLKGTALKLRCGEERASDEVFAAVGQSYLRHTRLDPYALAPSLSHTPVFMVHARQDQTVPAATGELLYERLGRPDRLDFSMDHYKLFYFIPDQAPRVADWLERHTPRADESSAPPARHPETSGSSNE